MKQCFMLAFMSLMTWNDFISCFLMIWAKSPMLMSLPLLLTLRFQQGIVSDVIIVTSVTSDTMAERERGIVSDVIPVTCDTRASK